MILEFDQEHLKAINSSSPPTYDDYANLVEQFRAAYTNKTCAFAFTHNEVRLIYLSLMTTKARLKAYDPKKGLNQ